MRNLRMRMRVPKEVKAVRLDHHLHQKDRHLGGADGADAAADRAREEVVGDRGAWFVLRNIIARDGTILPVKRFCHKQLIKIA